MPSYVAGRNWREAPASRLRSDPSFVSAHSGCNIATFSRKSAQTGPLLPPFREIAAAPTKTPLHHACDKRPPDRFRLRANSLASASRPRTSAPAADPAPLQRCGQRGRRSRERGGEAEAAALEKVEPRALFSFGKQKHRAHAYSRSQPHDETGERGGGERESAARLAEEMGVSAVSIRRGMLANACIGAQMGSNGRASCSSLTALPIRLRSSVRGL